MPDKKSTSTSSTSVADRGPGGSDLGRASYSAVQARDAVIVFAFGWHPTPGFVDFFEQSPIDVFPPEFIFRTIPPIGPVLQVLTPFAIWVMFGASDPIKTVTVHDADGAHKIEVQQASDQLAAAQQRATWVSGSVVRGGAEGAIAAMPTTMATGEESGSGPTTMATGEENFMAPTTMATGEESGGGPTTMATGEEEASIATTLALGEEQPPITTLAIGEESPFTTLRFGEEGPTTLAIGEETATTFGLTPTTLAVGEEDPTPTTLALGEEGPTTQALGEEGPTTQALGEEGPTTLALGEETGAVAFQQTPFGRF